MRRPLIIVPCSATKNPLLTTRPLPARIAYAGQAFLFARRYLEDNQPELRWVILSAKFGFLRPGDQVTYYDTRLRGSRIPPEVVASVALMPHWRRKWIESFDRYICLGGEAYCHAAEVALGRRVERPLKGLGLGLRLRNLKHADWDANDWATR